MTVYRWILRILGIEAFGRLHSLEGRVESFEQGLTASSVLAVLAFEDVAGGSDVV